MYLETFPAESYLSHQIPDHKAEWDNAIYRLITCTFVFIFVVPVIIKAMFAPLPKATTTITSDQEKIKLNGKGKKRERRGKSSKNQQKTDLSLNNPTAAPDQAEIHVPGYVFPCVNSIYFIALFVIIAVTPNNSYSARRVYVGPMLRAEECKRIIDMGTAAASRRTEKARLALKEDNDFRSQTEKELELTLQDPAGWTKDRHDSYPTTDLNVVEDFTTDDKQFLVDIFDARLAPILERLYGVSRDSIRANDIFLVRYDGDGQQSLSQHTDSSHVSFNILLNDDFKGGGTRFHNRAEESYHDVKPDAGEVIINNALVTHEGLATTEGTRYILVGFINFERKNPFTGSPTALSRFSSWLSFPWLSVTIKDGWEIRLLEKEKEEKNGMAKKARSSMTLSDGKFIDHILHYSIIWFALLGDIFANHDITSMVEKRDYESYISTLDDAAYSAQRMANWMQGQNIQVSLDGTVGRRWKTQLNKERAANEDL